MKVSKFLLLLPAATALAPSSFGFAEFARGELLLSTSARALYDSRVYGGFNDADDYVFSLEPRLLYRREAGQLKLDSHLGMRFNRYLDFTELDSEDLLASVRLTLPPETAAVASGSFEVGYDEHTDVNYDVNTRIREKTFFSRLNTLIPTGLKTSLIFGASYRDENRNNFNDREALEATAGFRYSEFLGDTTFEARYRRLEVETSGGNFWGIPLDQSSDIYTASLSRPIYGNVRGSISYGYRVLRRSRAEVLGGDTSDGGSIFSVNLDGPFLSETRFPKLDSSLSFGYQKAETPGVADSGGNRFVGSARLAWQARERTRVFIQARRSQELSVQDFTTEATTAEIGVNQAIGNFTNASASIGYEERDYRGATRTDEAFIANLGASYRITREWSASGSYRLRAQDSTLARADYDRHVFWLSASYTF